MFQKLFQAVHNNKHLLTFIAGIGLAVVGEQSGRRGVEIHAVGLLVGEQVVYVVGNHQQIVLPGQLNQFLALVCSWFD